MQQTDLKNFSGKIYTLRESKYFPATTEEIEKAACFEVIGDMALITGFKK